MTRAVYCPPVMKRQITCVRCGFKAFVDSTGLWELSDWLILDYQLGRALCPACMGEAVPDDAARPTLAKTAR